MIRVALVVYIVCVAALGQLIPRFLHLAAREAVAAVKVTRVTVDYPKWMPRWWRLLSVCETRGNPRHRATCNYGASTCVGAFGMTELLYDRTKVKLKLTLPADRETLWNQYRVARRAKADGARWGCEH